MASIQRLYGACTAILTPNVLVVVGCILVIARLALAYVGALPPINTDSPDLSAPGLLMTRL
jgi:hypothetical protein